MFDARVITTLDQADKKHHSDQFQVFTRYAAPVSSESRGHSRKLLAAAGSCSKCPKRSGNQPLVFVDVKSADVCTDPDCFEEKRAAQYAKVIVIANKTGVPVLEGDEAKQINAYVRGSEFVAGNTPIWNFDRNAPPTGNSGRAEDYIGKDNMPKPAKYLKDSSGVVTPIYDRAAVQAALEKVGACETVDAHAARMAEQERAHQEKGDAPPSAEQLQREKSKQMAAKETDFRVALYRKLRQRGANGFSLASLREFVKLMVRSYNDYAIPDDLIGDLYPFPEATDAAVCAYIDQATLPEVQLILVDLVMGECLGVDAFDIHDLEDANSAPTWNTLVDMARHEGVDAQLERREHDIRSTAVADIASEDFYDLIRLMPERLAELTTVVMETQPHNIAALERAANDNGYTWSKWKTPTPGSAWVKSDGAVTEVASSEIAPADAINQVSTEAAIADGDYVDPADFIQAAPEPAKRAGKAKTPKVKPTALAPAPAEAWPWPKSATTSDADNKSETTEKEAA